jgi:hypothetical protein
LDGPEIYKRSTAAYLYDTGDILKTWLRGLAFEQTKDGNEYALGVETLREY